MASLTDAILYALSPGVALTSVIFYNTSLQNRFVYITGRARDLNKEARQLMTTGYEPNAERIESIRDQVSLMTQRARSIRRSILVVYVALFSFILTIIELLGLAVFQVTDWQILPVVSFAVGFLALGAATVFSGLEMAIAQSTLSEDIRTSFPPKPSRD